MKNTVMKMSCALSLFFGLIAGAATSQAESSSFDLTQLQFGGLYVSQSGGDSYSGMLSWDPSYSFNADFKVRLNLGATLLKGMGSTFAALDYELFANYTFIPHWEIEAGGGLQTWVSNGGTQPIVSANLNWHPTENFFKVINLVYAGYSRFMLPNAGANQVHVGLGFVI